jgi:glycosyltransferase involved in cell wall biosynthesis
MPKICAIVPTYDNPRTIRGVVEQVRPHLPVVVVDDGSGPEGRRAVAELAREGLAHVVVRERNGGKGAAVKDGFREARVLGYTHALQIDADGQYDVRDMPRFLAAARAQPDALVLGEPIFDDTAPRGRTRGHRFCRIWTTLATGGPVIRDVLCGYRVYPLEAALRLGCGDRMEFDVEIAIRLVWAGCPVVNLPTRIRYLSAEEGGVSHFRLFRDNVRIVSRYFWWCTLGLLRLAAGWAPPRAAPAEAEVAGPGVYDPQGEP